MNNKQSDAGSNKVTIDQQLIEEGIGQLTREIGVLEAWLRELDASNEGDAEAAAARKSYNDMLQNRKEMLSSLARQAKLQAVVTD